MLKLCVSLCRCFYYIYAWCSNYMQHAQCGVIYFTTSATSWVCRTRQCTGVANGALQTQPGSCLVRQIAQKKGGGKRKPGSLPPSPSTAIILGVHRGLSMIIGRAENKNLPFLCAGSSYWILLARSIWVKVRLECRLQLGTLSVCWALREVANTTKVHFHPRIKDTK